jgi:hypothetical protein
MTTIMTTTTAMDHATKAAITTIGHHGNENELDVVSSRRAPCARRRQAGRHRHRSSRPAVIAFSDWEITLRRRDRRPGPTLHRLKLKDGNGHFPLKIEQPGHYLVFDRHDVATPLHINVGAKS